MHQQKNTAIFFTALYLYHGIARWYFHFSLLDNIFLTTSNDLVNNNA